MAKPTGPIAKASKTGKARPRKLDERRKLFCRNIVAGMTQQAAYAAAGYAGGWKGGADKLQKEPLVRRHIEMLQAIQQRRLNVTLDTLVLDFRRAQDIAEETGNASAYATATTGLAKLMGFLKEDREGDINIIINRPLRDPSKELELSPDQWIAKWAPKQLEKPNGQGNGHA